VDCRDQKEKDLGASGLVTGRKEARNKEKTCPTVNRSKKDSRPALGKE